MALTQAQIMALARQFASDNDTVNPFWSDNNLKILIENWNVDMASYLRYPRATSAPINLVVGQDDYDLPIDWLSTIRLWIYDGVNLISKLKYKSEDEISEIDPNWRNSTSYGTPRYYFAANDITPGSTLSRKFFIYPAPSTAWNMIHVYVKVPTAFAATTDIPVFPSPMHILAVYYCAWQMLLPLNATKAIYYENLYKSERRRMCGEGRKESEDSNIILLK